MKLDLETPLLKVTSESERCVLPSETYSRARRALAERGIGLELTVHNYDDVFWAADVDYALPDNEKPLDRMVRFSGKGPSKHQCMASGSMEFIERWSFDRVNSLNRRDFLCLDLRDGETYSLQPVLEFRNTRCVSAGNTYEEAVLHSLHELLETRPRNTLPWEHYCILSVREMFPDFPDWIDESVVLFMTPTGGRAFYHIIAVLYPFAGEFDQTREYKITKRDGRLHLHRSSTVPKPHSPNTGGAAGLNPRMTAFRAMNEIFQFRPEGFTVRGARKKNHPPWMPRMSVSDLPNYETDSITGDIMHILEILGEETFVGAVDFTDPELDIPVVKVVSDYSPRGSLVTREVLGHFFDLPG